VVVGVLAPTPAERRSDTTEVWLPLTLPVPITSEYYYLAVFARLRDGFSVEQARAEMRTLSAGLVELYPDEKKGFSAIVDRYIDRVGPETSRPLVTLMLTAAAVLLISCVNLANLLMASATGRAHELALRRALGASRGRVVFMLLMESLVLSAIGAAASAIIGYALIVGIRTAHAFGFPSDVDIAMDGRVFAFLGVATLVTCLLVGLGPALRAAGAEPAEVLKGGLRTLSPGRRGVVARHVFVAGQVAIGFVLLAIAGLLVRSLQRVNAVDVGFDANGVLAARLPLQMGANPDPERLGQYVTRILEQVSAVPGVRAAAFTSALPFEAWSDGSPFRWPGGQLEESQTTGLKVVTPGYFRTLGLRVLKGRVFDDRDRAGSPPVLIVNKHFAARFLRGKDPVGARLLMKELTPSRRGAGPEVTWEIVGIVADEKAAGLEEPDDVGAYVSFFQMPGVDADTALVTRTDVGRPGAMVKPIERAIWSVNPGQAIDSPTTADDLKAQATLSRRLLTGLLGGFALLAMLLACSGLYGLLSFVTAARTKELGIRAALGATRTRLVGGVVVEGAVPVAVGLVIGLGGVIAFARMIEALLFDTSPLEPASLVGAAALFLVVAFSACFVPAWRAASVSPMTALRQQQ
jgi:putative ABC transport system permease protein